MDGNFPENSRELSCDKKSGISNNINKFKSKTILFFQGFDEKVLSKSLALFLLSMCSLRV